MNLFFTLLAWAPDALVIPLAWLALRKWAYSFAQNAKDIKITD